MRRRYFDLCVTASSRTMLTFKNNVSCSSRDCSTIGQFHDERDKVKINKYVYFHCKLIALTQTVLYVLGKNIFILLANLFS